MIKMSIDNDPSNIPKAMVKPGSKRPEKPGGTLGKTRMINGKTLQRDHSYTLVNNYCQYDACASQILHAKSTWRPNFYLQVCCHLETLRSSVSPTQPYTAGGCHLLERKEIIIPPYSTFRYTGCNTLQRRVQQTPCFQWFCLGLDKYLNSYKLGGDLLQALNMT